MTDYAEAVEENGAIVALDQEKAYDKIDHAYLLRVLREFRLPETFVQAVETLYSQAHTAVMINGVLSKRFKVTRGVRQGDPLSCLLFNLAIEPLAEMLRRSELRGYNIPGLAYKLIATLYADDTTVYLAEGDSYQSLLRILDTWCRAATAKFNVLKTEIIPLGTPEYRANLIATRKLNEDDVEIPASVRIANDGQATRILGTWPGNDVDATAAWGPILEKMDTRLEQWIRSHPTHEGRSLLLQVIAGGFTQYLAAAQGMPKKTEERVDKAVSNFFWDNAVRHTINMTELQKQKHDGGKALFNAKSRNDAAYIVWLSKYLAPAEERPTWALLADTLFAVNARRADATRVQLEHRIDPFRQEWKPNARKLPFILRQMARVAKTYNLVLDRPYVPYEIRGMMPAWSHPALTTRARENTPAAKCLKRHHEVSTIEHLEEIAELDEMDHVDEPDCDCPNCEADREAGCEAPHRCREAANDHLALLAPKWNLNTAMQEHPTPIAEALGEPTDAAIKRGDAVIVRPYAGTPPSEIAHLYRIFARNLAIAPLDPRDIQQRDAAIPEGEPTGRATAVVYACGSTLHGRTANATGGYAVHFPNGEHRDASASCPGKIHSQERTAAFAITKAALMADPSAPLFIVTNSQSAVRKLTILLEKNEKNGWLDTPRSADAFRQALAAIRRRAAETTIACITKKHDRPEVRLMTDTTRVARTAARGAAPHRVDTDTLATFDQPGIELRGITQRVAQRAIRHIEATRAEPRRATTRNLQKVGESVRRQNGKAPLDEHVWRSMKSKDLSRNFRNYAWKGVHGGHKIGPYFENMPAPWCDYATCPECNVREDMQHILFECSNHATEQVWQLARDFVAPRLGQWPRLDVGSVYGCGLLEFKGQGPKTDKPLSRAMKIIISESAFLIWKLRCERRIEYENDRTKFPSQQEITGRWYAAINARIMHDKHLTNRRRYQKRALKGELVRQTWEGLLEFDGDPPENWIRHPGVLVGRGTSRVRGRER